MHIQNWKKEVWTIPNLLSMLRLILIPVYIYIYRNATQPYHYAITAGIVAISCLTDLIDGKIARRFQMVSTLGKVLDPIADKATQLSLLICLAISHPVINGLLALFLIKESFQTVAGIIFLCKGKMLDGALISGKICTTVLFLSLILMILFPNMSATAIQCIMLLCMTAMIAALFGYIRAYIGKNNKLHDLNA